MQAALETNDQEHAAALQAKDPEHAAALRENYQAWARRHRSMRNSTLQAQANSLSSFMDSISYVLYTWAVQRTTQLKRAYTGYPLHWS